MVWDARFERATSRFQAESSDQAELIPDVWRPQSDSNGPLRAFNAALIQLSYRGKSGTGARI